MMHKLAVDEMIQGKISNYPLVVAVARRAREITEDASLNSKSATEKPVRMAFEDFKSHRYEIYGCD